MTTAVAALETTVDAFLGGRVEAVQMRSAHHRAGLEAVLLSSAIPATFTGTVADLGAGVGVAGLCIAARAEGARVLLVERDPEALACARQALERPANRTFAGRVTIAAADISAAEAERVAAGLGRAVSDAVVMNPPFQEGGEGTRSPADHRTAAHVLGDGGLDPWFRAAASALKPGGTLVVIFRADRLDALLAAMRERFGGLTILPVAPRAGKPALRVVVRGILGSRAPASLLPPFTLHETAGGTYLPEAGRILREGAALAEVHPAWGPQKG